MDSDRGLLNRKRLYPHEDLSYCIGIFTPEPTFGGL